MHVFWSIIVTLTLAAVSLLALSQIRTMPPEDELSQVLERAAPSSEFTPPALIDYQNRGLTRFPSDALGTPTTRELNLSRNAITAIPAEIRQIAELEVLDVSANQLTGLPAEIGQLSKLRILNVSGNQLTGIPHELGNLQKLELLDLRGNDIAAFDLDIIRSRLPASTIVLE